jgi:peroxiredoxin
MKLQAPRAIIDFDSHDVYGNPIRLSEFKGKKVILAFFRDAACPFCNLRVYELTQRYKEFNTRTLRLLPCSVPVMKTCAITLRGTLARFVW